MVRASRFFRYELEPPPWLYVRLARGPISRLIYRRLTGDLAGILPLEARLLDIGAGPGYLMDHLAEARPDLKLFALDRSYSMMRQGWQRGQSPTTARFLAADALALPFEARVFDFTLATFSLHLWAAPEIGVKEMVRVLRPGGRARIYEMNREAALSELKAFAREEKIPLPLLYPGFRILSRYHGLRARDFRSVLPQAGARRWSLKPAHHLFWRAELEV